MINPRSIHLQTLELILEKKGYSDEEAWNLMQPIVNEDDKRFFSEFHKFREKFINLPDKNV